MIRARNFLFAMVILPFLAGAQNNPFIFVFLNKKDDRPKVTPQEEKRIMDGHMANIRRLAAEEKLISAGPFMDAGGIFIFNTNSIEQANEWLKTDPGVQAKRWNLELLPYTPRVGSACTVKEPIQMVSYEFVRFTLNVTKYNVQNAPETTQKHVEYLAALTKTGNVVAEGAFGDEGGVLIMRGELNHAVIDADPGVIEGLFVAEFRKLFIAKGAFCEQYD